MLRAAVMFAVAFLCGFGVANAADEPSWRYDIELVHHPADHEHPWLLRVTETSDAHALGYAAPEVKGYVDYSKQEFQARVPLAPNMARLNYAIAWYTAGNFSSQPKQVTCRDSIEDHALVIRFAVPPTTDERFLFRLFLKAQIGPGQAFRSSSAGWAEAERVVLFLSPHDVFDWVRDGSIKVSAAEAPAAVTPSS